jgi:hypothetical protein
LAVEVRFIAVCLAHGNSSDRLVGFDINDQHDQTIQQADADHAPLAIVRPAVLDQHHRAGEYSGRVGEVQPMLLEVGLPPGFVPDIAQEAIYTY